MITESKDRYFHRKMILITSSKVRLSAKKRRMYGVWHSMDVKPGKFQL